MSSIKAVNNKFTLNKNLTAIILLFFIIALGTVLRFYDLGAESFDSDELIIIRLAQPDFGPIFRSLMVESPGRPALIVFLTHFWVKLFGTSEVAARSLSAVASIAALPIIYAIGHDLFGRRVGLISALLMAMGSIQVLQAQNLRYYGVLILVVVLSYYFYLRFLSRKSNLDLVLYIIFSILIYHAHFMSIFVLVAQGLYFLLYWNKYKDVRGRWVLAQILIVLGFGYQMFYTVFPGFAAVASQELEHSSFHPASHLPDQPLWAPLFTLKAYVFASPGTVGVNWQAIAVAMVFFAGGTVLFAVHQGIPRWWASVKALTTVLRDLLSKKSEIILVGLWLLCPIIIPLILSKIFIPMYLHRYTMGASPALYLLLALGIVGVRKTVPEVVSVGALMIVMTFGLQDYYAANVKIPWREITTHVAEYAGPDDTIIFARKNGWTGSFYWYYQGQGLRECETDPQLEVEGMLETAAEDCRTGNGRIWLLAQGDERVGQAERVLTGTEPNTVRSMNEKHFYGPRKVDIAIHLIEMD